MKTWFPQPIVMMVPTFCNDLIDIAVQNSEPFCVIFVLRIVIIFRRIQFFLWKKVFMYKVHSVPLKCGPILQDITWMITGTQIEYNRCWIRKKHPISRLTGGVFCEYFRANRPRYNGTALYLLNQMQRTEEPDIPTPTMIPSCEWGAFTCAWIVNPLNGYRAFMACIFDRALDIM